MKTLKYKFGDTVEFNSYTINNIHQGIIWNAYDVGSSLTDYTIINETQFLDINETQIIKKLTKLEPLEYKKIGTHDMYTLQNDRVLDLNNSDEFSIHPLKETITLLNVITRTDSFDLQIVNYLNKVISNYNKVKLNKTSLSSVVLYSTKLLNLIKDKQHELQSR